MIPLVDTMPLSYPNARDLKQRGRRREEGLGSLRSEQIGRRKGQGAVALEDSRVRRKCERISGSRSGVNGGARRWGRVVLGFEVGRDASEAVVEATGAGVRGRIDGIGRGGREGATGGAKRIRQGRMLRHGVDARDHKVPAGGADGVETW